MKNLHAQKFFSNFLFIIFRNGDRYLQKNNIKYNNVTRLRWYGLEILRNIPGTRSSDVLDFRSSISKWFSVLVPTTEGDLASVHCKSTTQEKKARSATHWRCSFSCLAEHEVEDTGGCQAVLVLLRSSHWIWIFFSGFIVTLLQGSCDFKHSIGSGWLVLPLDVNSVLPSPCPAFRDW